MHTLQTGNQVSLDNDGEVGGARGLYKRCIRWVIHHKGSLSSEDYAVAQAGAGAGSLCTITFGSSSSMMVHNSASFNFQPTKLVTQLVIIHSIRN